MYYSNGFNFRTLASAVKMNPLVTVKGDLCTSLVGQVLHVHLMMATLEMYIDMSTKRYGRQLLEKN